MASIKRGQNGQKPSPLIGVAVFVAVLLIIGTQTLGLVIKSFNISPMGILFWIVVAVIVFIILSGLRVVDQYEKGIY